MPDSFDCIIIGAGPAGLSLGSVLSGNHRVLVLEKGERPHTNEWFTKEEYLTENGLSRFISCFFDKSVLETSMEGNRYVYNGPYVNVDGPALMQYFRDMVVENGGEVRFGEEFLGCSPEGDKVNVVTRSGRYVTRLLVDASGNGSHLSKKYRIRNKTIYYSLYGEKYFGGLAPEEVNMLSVYDRKAFPLSFFEALPSGKDEFYAFTFHLSGRPSSAEVLGAQHVSNMSHLRKGALPERKDSFYGVIPLGSARKRAVDNIFFYGDSVNLASSFSGSGFTEIMKTYRKTAAHLHECLAGDRLGGSDLDCAPGFREMYNREFNIFISLALKNFRFNDFAMLVDSMSLLPDRYTDLIFTGEVYKKDVRDMYRKLFAVRKFKKTIARVAFSADGIRLLNTFNRFAKYYKLADE